MTVSLFAGLDRQSPLFRTWTVTELTEYIKDLLELDPELQEVQLTGEISNFSRASSGHLYFTLKDAGAVIDCVMWRSSAARLGWRPAQGDAVLATGRVSVYPARGRYQLYVEQMRPAGLGDLHARFEQLRDQLRQEGLFDEERKRPLPPFPRLIGIATSAQAAALRDVLNILQRRYPLARVILAPTLVQGDGAPPQIVAALRTLDALVDIDVILLVRGGGSLEELWAFNDERVARAIAACQHPVISGVGHETDFTISDFVADVRAPTPSAAAELVVPDQADLRPRIEGWVTHLANGMRRQLDGMRQDLAHQQRVLQRLSPKARMDLLRQQADDLSRRADQALAQALAGRRSELVSLRARLDALSPQATLERGYAIVRQRDTSAVVRTVAQVRGGDKLDIRVSDGEFGAQAEG
jgi:exodeoxyribonuclease VII large subunit